MTLTEIYNEHILKILSNSRMEASAEKSLPLPTREAVRTLG